MASYERHDRRTDDHGPHWKPASSSEPSSGKGEARVVRGGRPKVLARLPNLDVAELDRVVGNPTPRTGRQILHQRLSAAVLIGGTVLLVVVAFLPSRTARNPDGSWPMRVPAPTAPAAPAWDGLAGGTSGGPTVNPTLNAPPAPITIPAVPASIPGGPSAASGSSTSTSAGNAPPSSVLMPAVPASPGQPAPIPSMPARGAIHPQSSAPTQPASPVATYPSAQRNSVPSWNAAAYPATAAAMGLASGGPTTANTPPAFGGPSAEAAGSDRALLTAAAPSSAANAASAGAALLADRSAAAGYPTAPRYPTTASQPGAAASGLLPQGLPAMATTAPPTSPYPSTAAVAYPVAGVAENAAYPMTAYPATPQATGYEPLQPHPGYYQAAGAAQATANRAMGLAGQPADYPSTTAGGSRSAASSQPSAAVLGGAGREAVPAAAAGAALPAAAGSPEHSAYRSPNEIPRSSLY